MKSSHYSRMNQRESMLAVLFSALFLVVNLSSLRAQGLNSDGRDFYLGYLAPSILDQKSDSAVAKANAFFGMYALITSYQNNEITINYFDSTGGEVDKKVYYINGKHTQQVALDTNRMRMHGPCDEPQYRSCHITAKRPINVSYFTYGVCAGGSYLASATSTLGKKYVVQSYHDNVGGVGGLLDHSTSVGSFMVVATEEGTQVEITPSSTTACGDVGVTCGVGATSAFHPFTVNLNRGECYLVKSAGKSIGCNISGSTVIASKPIVVLAGHENAHTDGSDSLLPSQLHLEARDFMVEEMLPVEYWDTTGYWSIPFLDSKPPASGGQGDEYELLSGVLPTLHPTEPGLGQVSTVVNALVLDTLLPYQNEPVRALNVTLPVHCFSPNGTKIGVIEYDQRMHGGGAPYPAPSQTTIIPKSRWKKNYLMYVPNNTFEILQGYYFNIVCYREDYDQHHLKVSFNNGKLAPINTMGLKKSYRTIPDNDSLAGFTFAVGPGAYSFSIDTPGRPFMIYNYGFRAIDPDRDLGDFDTDDYFFGYSAPSGFMKLGDSENAGKLMVTVDTLCDHWHICVTDERAKDAGIKSIQILDDPDGAILLPPRVSHNVRFDPSAVGVIENYPYELNLSGNESTFCTDVFVDRLNDSSLAWVNVIDNDGDNHLLRLSAKPVRLSISSWPVSETGFDSISLPTIYPDADTCISVRVRNSGTPGDPNVVITSASVQPSDQFRIAGTSPTLPVTLAPGDSASIDVCFHPTKTGTYAAILRIATSCADLNVTLSGRGAIPMIYATNRDFGEVVIGESRCDTITIRNIGELALTVTDSVIHACVHGNSTDFTWDAGSPYNKDRLPIVVQPNQFVRIGFCFTPSLAGFDSTGISWQTDIIPKYKDSVKPFSILRGTGIKPGVVWDRLTDLRYADSNAVPHELTWRVYLRNTRIATTYVDSVVVRGVDANEFSIGENQLGLSPLDRFAISPGDSIYVMISWMLDLNRARAEWFSPRHARLIALFPSVDGGGNPTQDSTVDDITVKFRDSDSLSASIAFPDVSSNMTSTIFGGRLVLRVPSILGSIPSIEVYDLLGRRVESWLNLPTVSSGELSLPIPGLSAGVYILRASGKGHTASCKLILR